MAGVLTMSFLRKRRTIMVKRSEKLKQMLKSVMEKTYDLGVVGNRQFVPFIV